MLGPATKIIELDPMMTTLLFTTEYGVWCIKYFAHARED